jgi:hypothetical protein
MPLCVRVIGWAAIGVQQSEECVHEGCTAQGALHFTLESGVAGGLAHFVRVEMPWWAGRGG